MLDTLLLCMHVITGKYKYKYSVHSTYMYVHTTWMIYTVYMYVM